MRRNASYTQRLSTEIKINDVSPDAFVEKVKGVKPNIVGMSWVLNLALDSMKMS